MNLNKAEFTNAIPLQLKELKHWVCWRSETRDGKPTKVPINPVTGGGAMSNNPSTWKDFETALNMVNKHKCNGIGFMFSKENMTAGIDLDHCRDKETGIIEAWAVDVINLFKGKAYIETSPTGTGIHIIFFGKLPPEGRRKDNVEMYDENRFFTITGNVLKEYSGNMENCTAELEVIHKQYIAKPEKKKNTMQPVICNYDTTDILKKAMEAANGSKFKTLYDGNWQGSYPSQSEADLALCNQLAFWFGRDSAKMDTVFRQSGLYRDKWDKKHGADTYGNMTLQEAINNCREIYDPEKSYYWPNNSAAEKQDKQYKCTDAGNSELFADMLREKYLYVAEQKSFYFYNGKVWEEDIKSQIIQDVIKCIRQAQKDALNIEDEDRRTKTLKWLLYSESQSKINAAINLMTSVQFMSARLNQFDNDDMLLNCQNGTINLRTGDLQKHNKADYVTKMCNVEYNPTANREFFEKFLDEITEGNADKKKYLQRLCGYCLTGKITEEEFYQAKGSGQNGKTKLFETIKYVLGSYATTASPDILMAKDMTSIPNDIARLNGARLVLMSEPDPGKRFSDNAIKSLTGGDTIIARFLHKEYFEFSMKAKMIMLTNHEIKAIGTDHGLWRRMVIIPFTYQVPEEKKDKHLQDKLIASAESVLAWMVEGCLHWQREGLKQPQDLIQAKDEYRQGQDAVGLFLDENCVEDPKAKISATELYHSYTNWCNETGEFEISQRLFGTRLREKGYTRVKSGTYYWFGLRFLDHRDLLDQKQINQKNKNLYKDLLENGPKGPKGPKFKKGDAWEFPDSDIPF